MSKSRPPRPTIRPTPSGGPGNNPNPGVAHTAPGPPDPEPATLARDAPLTVGYGGG